MRCSVHDMSPTIGVCQHVSDAAMNGGSYIAEPVRECRVCLDGWLERHVLCSDCANKADRYMATHYGVSERQFFKIDPPLTIYCSFCVEELYVRIGRKLDDDLRGLPLPIVYR